MRDIERLLVVANVVGSVALGARHDATWFLIPLAAFGLYVVLADRALRRRIGPRHWPSDWLKDCVTRAGRRVPAIRAWIMVPGCRCAISIPRQRFRWCPCR